MRNLKLNVKLLLLGGIFTACLAVVGYTGWNNLRTLGHSVDLLGNIYLPEVLDLAQAQSSLLTSIRAQKNAVMAPDDKQSEAYAKTSREDLNSAKELVSKLLAQINQRELGKLSSSKTLQQAINELQSSLKEFESVNEECLELAVQNSNLKANALLFTSVRPGIESIDEVLLREKNKLPTSSAADAKAPEIKLPMDELIAAAWQLMSNLAQHNNTSTTDPAFATVDRDVAQSIQKINVLSDEIATRGAAIGSLSAVRTLAQEIASDAQRVVELSKEDTNTRSTEISLNSARDKATKAIDAMNKLYEGYRAEESLAVETSAKTRDQGLFWIPVASLLGLAFGAVAATIIARGIVGPVARVRELAGRMAAGDLTARIGLKQRDEVGELSEATDKLADSLSNIVSRLQTNAQGLGGSSESLSTIASSLAAQSHQATDRSTSVAAAAEELSANINSMSAAAEQMSMNFASISSATEEMSVNVGAISSAAEQTSANVGVVAKAVQDISGSFTTVLSDVRAGAKVASDAESMANSASKTMRDLDQASADISDFTETIKMIALQTNLLALNATIEATAAGEAGKGFAVVAHEIKELANQSARAAEDISKKIESVQAGTHEAVGVMREISLVIKSISDSAERITQSVEHQTHSAATISTNIVEANKGVGHIARAINEVSVTARDMARNLAEATRGATDVSRNVSEAATASRGISSSIVDVTTSAKETSRSAVAVTQTSTSLADMARELQKLAEMFKIAPHGKS